MFVFVFTLHEDSIDEVEYPPLNPPNFTVFALPDFPRESHDLLVGSRDLPSGHSLVSNTRCAGFIDDCGIAIETGTNNG